MSLLENTIKMGIYISMPILNQMNQSKSAGCLFLIWSQKVRIITLISQNVYIQISARNTARRNKILLQILIIKTRRRPLKKSRMKQDEELSLVNLFQTSSLNTQNRSSITRESTSQLPSLGYIPLSRQQRIEPEESGSGVTQELVKAISLESTANSTTSSSSLSLSPNGSTVTKEKKLCSQMTTTARLPQPTCLRSGQIVMPRMEKSKEVQCP